MLFRSDIAPRHLDNQYRNITPGARDTIFFFEGNTVLASQNGDNITYPEYGDFIEKVKKASGTDSYPDLPGYKYGKPGSYPCFLQVSFAHLHNA